MNYSDSQENFNFVFRYLVYLRKLELFLGTVVEEERRFVCAHFLKWV